MTSTRATSTRAIAVMIAACALTGALAGCSGDDSVHLSGRLDRKERTPAHYESTTVPNSPISDHYTQQYRAPESYRIDFTRPDGTTASADVPLQVFDTLVVGAPFDVTYEMR